MEGLKIIPDYALNEINKDKVIIKTIDELEIGKNLKIFYDEKIY